MILVEPAEPTLVELAEQVILVEPAEPTLVEPAEQVIPVEPTPAELIPAEPTLVGTVQECRQIPEPQQAPVLQLMRHP